MAHIRLRHLYRQKKNKYATIRGHIMGFNREQTHPVKSVIIIHENPNVKLLERKKETA